VTTVSPDGKREGMTINSFASVSLAPPLILWSIRDDARSADAFIGGPHFILSVLASSQHAMAMHFARPAQDKFADWSNDFEQGIGGCPRLRESAATFECTTYSRYQEGDHTILLAASRAILKTSALPLMLHMGEMARCRLAKTLTSAEFTGCRLHEFTEHYACRFTSREPRTG
jgi:flavin reductase (DIM6/NTAB) family NADH-FMN oxidoreductase RutF